MHSREPLIESGRTRKREPALSWASSAFCGSPGMVHARSGERGKAERRSASSRQQARAFVWAARPTPDFAEHWQELGAQVSKKRRNCEQLVHVRLLMTNMVADKGKVGRSSRGRGLLPGDKVSQRASPPPYTRRFVIRLTSKLRPQRRLRRRQAEPAGQPTRTHRARHDPDRRPRSISGSALPEGR